MLHKYFKFTKKRILVFLSILTLILGLQWLLTGSMVSRQKITTEAGNAESSVIGILDDTEVIRQKFSFDRKVVLSEFAISFGSFERKNVGKDLHIQMTDGDNTIVYETTVPVKEITPNSVYTVAMDHTVTIPKGVTVCVRLTCSSDQNPYAVIPTVNTTNRTDPNTYMSTMKMQTRKKSLNISYTYYYRQIYPLVVLLAEFGVLFVLCFERVTEYAIILRKRRWKEERRKKKKAPRKQKKSQDFSIKKFVKWCLTEPKVLRYTQRAVVIINPLLLFVLLEMMNGTFARIYPNVWIFTWILLGGIQLLLFALIGNINIAMLVMDLILFPIGLTNLFIMNVRGTPFLPADILGVTTATEVADHYTLSLTPAQFSVLPAFILWCLLILRLKKKKLSGTRLQKTVRHLIPVAASFSIFFLLYSTPILETFGIKDSVWNKVASCKANGFYLNYFINLHYLKVAQPSGYSQSRVEEILTDFEKEFAKENAVTTANAGNQNIQPDSQGDLGQTETDIPTEKKIRTNSDFEPVKSLNGKKPNIILIMNESLADFSKLGDVTYNRDPLEFMHSLKKNTISGLDYVSIFGAGTSNSEFEAMTGNSMKFFPSGSNVYQQFMHDSTYSLPSYLKSLGYSTEAIHPSSGANWNRINTYRSMKFDKFITIDDFKNPEYVRYISDKESYKKVIERFEARDKDVPFFMFDLTIQNHGGYLTNTNWENPVEVVGSYLAETKEFLSATKVSDDAFRYLIDYFKKVDEPTLICMFGDHQPSIETEFYETLLGKDQSEWELEDIQKRYATPFVLWANYDIEEEENLVLSNNYLENLLLKQAGLELPLYNQYVEKVSGKIPVMNVNGYMDNDGKWHKYNTEETEEISRLLDDYEILQYGYYSDTDKEKMSELFRMQN